jgi:ankyrin repeat protein
MKLTTITGVVSILLCLAQMGFLDAQSLRERKRSYPKALGALRQALRNAAQEGDEKNAALLLQRPEKELLINAPDPVTGETPLLLAVRKGHDRVTHMLLDAGANPVVQDKKGESALLYALRARNSELVDRMLEALAYYYPAETHAALNAARQEFGQEYKPRLSWGAWARERANSLLTGSAVTLAALGALLWWRYYRPELEAHQHLL